MKRMLTVVLTLVLICAALSGCGSIKDTGEPKTDEKSGTIALTIVEKDPTLPAFEYQDGDPYCFYTEDADGQMYRVMWGDFTGLKEKDRVIVKYNELKKLTYTDYPDGGWTPPYEMTATDVRVDNRVADPLVSHIQIRSGETSIYPFGRLMWSKTDNGDGTFKEVTVDTFDVVSLVSGQTDISTDTIPTLTLVDRATYTVQVNGRVESVYLLTPDGNTYTKTETTFDALSALSDGTYYVVLDVLLGGNCDPYAPQHFYRYEDVFRLTVGE